MVFHVVKKFISDDDVKIVQEYIKGISFNTKDNHPPLHDHLYTDFNAPFDIHTRGEMPDYILNIFSKYSEGLYKTLIKNIDVNYHAPMFSKHYIARCNTGFEIGPQWDESKPDRTIKSIIYWNNDFEGGKMSFPNIYVDGLTLEPGDLIYFVDCETNAHKISKITEGTLYMSEAWAGLKGKPWMFNVDYEKTDWDNWEIKGF